MKDSLELIDEKNLLKRKANILLAGCEKEQRKMTEEESKELDSIMSKIKEVEADIEKLQAGNNETEETPVEPKQEEINQEERKMKKFNLLKAINDVANNRQLDEMAQSVCKAGVEEMRKAGQSYSGQIQIPVEKRSIDGIITAGHAYTASTYSGGQEAIAEDKLGILETLRNNLVFSKAGATFMSGLVGDCSIPVFGGNSVAWAGETSSASNGTGTWSELTLSPKRLTAKVAVSKQFLNQTSPEAEAMLIKDLNTAIMEKLESQLLSSDATSGRPAGIFSSSILNTSADTDTDGLTYASLVKMETDIDGANVLGNKTFIVNPNAAYLLRTKNIDSGSGKFIMENGEINGIPVLVSKGVADKGVVCGAFDNYVIGQWGSIDITVDPYTLAADGQIQLVVNAYFDGKPKRSAAFTGKILSTSAPAQG